MIRAGTRRGADPRFDSIKEGDTFVRKYGRREQIYVFFQPTNSAKIHYMRLHAGSCDSIWSVYHFELEEKGWRYVGRIPPYYLRQLRNDWTLR